MSEVVIAPRATVTFWLALRKPFSVTDRRYLPGFKSENRKKAGGIGSDGLRVSGIGISEVTVAFATTAPFGPLSSRLRRQLQRSVQCLPGKQNAQQQDDQHRKVPNEFTPKIGRHRIP